MSKKKHFFATVIFLAFAMVWTWRYYTLNKYYDSISNINTEICDMHEEVPFGNNWIQMDMRADGYYLKVNEFEIVDYNEYLRDSAISVSNPYPPEKLALVHITLYNKDSDAAGVMLTELQLGGVDSIAGMDWDILTATNSILEGNYGICLPADTECELVLPYDLNKANYGNSTWKNIDKYDFYLRLTIWPVEKKILLES